MILFTFKTRTGLALGMKTAKGVLDVAAASAALGAGNTPVTPEAALAAGSEGLASLADLAQRASSRPQLFRDESGLEIGPCVANPSKIICVGLNYRQHAIESNMTVPETPVLFSKFNNSLAAPEETIPLPGNAVEYDYEAELGVVIGRRARYVSESEAMDYVLGYCTVNDLSARDLQFRTNQWLLGKTLDKFLPVGPYLVTADEVGDPQSLRIRCWLNGELRQDSTTGDMIFRVSYLISYLSQYMTLEPGDLISTGTPQGVIHGMKEKVWMKPGDETVVEVEKLGRLRNRMGI